MYTVPAMTTLSNQPQLLAGKTAIVTGAGRGAGAAMALALAQAGARVCASDLNPERAKRIAQQITDAGGDAFPFQADVSNKFQVSALIETTRDRYTTLDVFVHHGHITPIDAFLKMDEWEFRRTLDVNLAGAFFCLQLASRVMSDESGGVIFVPLHPIEAMGPGQVALAATQMGVRAMIEVLQQELAGTGVRIEALPLTEPAAMIDRLMTLCAVS